MGRVLVTRPLTEGGTDPLLEAGHEIVVPDDDRPVAGRAGAAGAASATGSSATSPTASTRRCSQAGRAGRLRVVGNAAVGYDNIDVAAAHALGITVCNTPGVLDDTTADLAFLLILAATRLATDAERDLREGRWTGGGSAPTWPATCTGRRSVWSASAASPGRWPSGRAASTWRSSTPPGTTPA